MLLPEPLLPRCNPLYHVTLFAHSLAYICLLACLLAYYTTILIINSTSHYIGDVMLVVNPWEWFGYGNQTWWCVSVMRVSWVRGE